MRRTVTVVALFLITTVLQAQTAGKEEAALQQLWNQFEEAFNRSDAAKVASLYAPDGDRINRAMEIARGRTEIAAQYEKEFAARKADASTVPFHSRLTIRLLDPQVAILDGEFEGSLAGKKVRGQFTVITKKGASGWQIAAGRVRGLKELGVSGP
ncbi:MAG: YybH family protein [Thermoanaerobaculia bacterium]